MFCLFTESTGLNSAIATKIPICVRVKTISMVKFVYELSRIKHFMVYTDDVYSPKTSHDVIISLGLAETLRSGIFLLTPDYVTKILNPITGKV